MSRGELKLGVPFARPQIPVTRELKRQNEYTLALNNEFAEFALNEERCLQYLGNWRSQIFKSDDKVAVDLEIGTGNGTHFAHLAKAEPQRCVVGIEIKYKPLIQSIRRALQAGARNARIVRAHAFNLDLIFGAEELNDIYIFFPDPWVSPRKPKNRILNPRMLDIFYHTQRKGSRLYFKTDSQEAFNWSLPNVRSSQFRVVHAVPDLDQLPQVAAKNFSTQFEKIFRRQGLPIAYIELLKEE